MTAPTASPDVPTIGDVLAPTGLPALLDQPVSDVLSNLGLSRIPAPLELAPPVVPGLEKFPGIDLPALPVLPGFDPAALLTPIVNLLGSFGTGSLPVDNSPVKALTALSGVLETGASALLSATQGLGGQWAGSGANAAITHATTTAAESNAIGSQGAAMAADVTVAAGIVSAGLAQLQGVLVTTAGLLAATAPIIATPPGQLAALSIAADGLAQALVVVASTRAQLATPTAKMAANGARLPVTGVPPSGAPTTSSSLDGLMSTVLPVVAAGLSGAANAMRGTAGPSSTSALAPTQPGNPHPGPTPGATYPTTGRQGACCPASDPSVASPVLSAKPGPTGASALPASAAPAGGGGALGGPPTSSVSVGPVEQPITLSDRPLTTNAVSAAMTAPVPDTLAAASSPATAVGLSDYQLASAELGAQGIAQPLAPAFAATSGLRDVGLRLGATRHDLADSG